MGPHIHFNQADFDAIPTLESQLFAKKPGLQEVAEFKQGMLQPDEYLEWLLTAVTQQVYGVCDRTGPARERGSGGRKQGAHSEGRHR